MSWNKRPIPFHLPATVSEQETGGGKPEQPRRDALYEVVNLLQGKRALAKDNLSPYRVTAGLS